MSDLDHAVILRKLALSLCLLCVLSAAVSLLAQGAPLSLVQIEKLVQIHSPDDLIAQEVRSRGLNFAPTHKTLDDLQRLGAGQATLTAVRERMPIGTLEVDAAPNSQIVLDGTDQGVTDSQGRLVLSSVAAGTHVLSVQKSGYKTGEFNITLAPKEYKRFPATLEWSGGYLSVRADPAGATIDISSLGQYKDSVSDLQCPPGTYDLTIIRAGTKTETRSVVVAAGQHASVEIHLVPDPNYLQGQLDDAKLRLTHGDPQGAIRISTDLLALQPKNVDLQSLLAEAYLQTHDMTHFQAAAANAILGGGTVVLNLAHEHWELSGEFIHLAKLTLTAKTIAYDPMGAACKYPALTAPIFNVSVSEVTNKTTSGFIVVRHLASGTFLLHLEIGEPARPNKRMTFYFATPDSEVVRQNNIGILSSPGNSSSDLTAISQLIQLVKANAGSK